MATSSSSDFRIFSSIWKEQLKKKKFLVKARRGPFEFVVIITIAIIIVGTKEGDAIVFWMTRNIRPRLCCHFSIFFKQKFSAELFVKGVNSIKTFKLSQ